MDNHKFLSLEDGWDTYIEAFGHLIKPEDIEAHITSYMVGAISYDSILFRAVEQFGPAAGTKFIKAMHEEVQAYVKIRKAEFVGKMVKRN